MENYPIKSVTFGGFDKQDVIKYIESQAQSAAQEQKELREEAERLRASLAEAQRSIDGLRMELDAKRTALAAAQEELAQERERRQALESLESLPSETERLRAEADALRPDAEAYARFRERLGSIECDARKRADDLERASAEKMRKAVARFREQYQSMMQIFETTASHVTGELRKVEVNLTQLPRAMDSSRAELSSLTEDLDKVLDEPEEGGKK